MTKKRPYWWIPTKTEIRRKCIIRGDRVDEEDVEVDLYPIKVRVKGTGEMKSFKEITDGKYVVYECYDGRTYYVDELDFHSPSDRSGECY